MKRITRTRPRRPGARAGGAPKRASPPSRPLTDKQFTWVSVLFGVLGVVVLASAIVPGHFAPRRFIDATYPRSPADDIGRDAVAYTSPLPPTQVAGDITDRWQPGRGCADAEGVYLRYAADTVVILRRQQGSLILVEKAATAYPRYLTHVTGHWDR